MSGVLVVVGGIVAIVMHQNMKMMIRPGGNKMFAELMVWHVFQPDGPGTILGTT
jgi:hypothetical protein